MNPRRACLVALAAATLALAVPAHAADKLVVAVNKLSAGSPLYIARAKGFFVEQDLDVSLLHSTSAQTIGLAVASGDAPIGMTALTAGIYTIAGKGGIKIVAGGYEEMPGFKGLALLFSNAAYERGARKPSDLVGMKVGTTQSGSPQENQLARLARKHGFNYSDMNVVPLQTLPNIVSAIKGGQIDATSVPATLALQIESSGAAKIVAWMADEVPGQIGGIFANATTIAQHPDIVVRFLRAYLKAIAVYDRAFQQKDPDGKPIKGDNYDEMLKIIADYLEEPPGQVAAGLPYFNPEARLAADDLREQILAWQSIRQLDAAISLNNVLEPSFLAAAKTASR
jgi:NitT/TauT family transport system substrate-binding protein